MELKDTIEMMTSPDYKERFKAEYYQLCIRYLKLQEMCRKWESGELDFTPTCPMGIYAYQLTFMRAYKNVLEYRASLENIDLDDIGYEKAKED